MQAGPSFTTAFEALVREHYEKLAIFAYRILHDRDEAEDAVQNVFLRVWERRDQSALNEPASYLYTAVRNQALMHVRRTQRWRAPADEDALDKLTVDTDVSDAADLAQAMERAVKALPEKTRLVYSMSREQHLSYAVIAQTLGISVKTVESQMARALRNLRVSLAPFLSAAFATVVGIGGQ